MVDALAVIAATHAVEDLSATSASAALLSDIATRVMGSASAKVLLAVW